MGSGGVGDTASACACMHAHMGHTWMGPKPHKPGHTHIHTLIPRTYLLVPRVDAPLLVPQIEGRGHKHLRLLWFVFVCLFFGVCVYSCVCVCSCVSTKNNTKHAVSAHLEGRVLRDAHPPNVHALRTEPRIVPVRWRGDFVRWWWWGVGSGGW